MTVGAWLSQREPAPPHRLAARLDAAVATIEPGSEALVAESLLAASEALLREVVGRPSAGRESALDLLAADALATYALEAAADAPESLNQCARDAMRRLAAVAAE